MPSNSPHKSGFIQTFARDVRVTLFAWLVGFGLILIGIYSAVSALVTTDLIIINGIMAFATLVGAIIMSTVAAKYITKPTRYIAHAVQHASSKGDTTAPDMHRLTLGRQLALSVSRQLYNSDSCNFCNKTSTQPNS